ncbi:MAG: hypothetical protein ACJ71G_04190 [Nitrososphaeraceae archaeon]
MTILTRLSQQQFKDTASIGLDAFRLALKFYHFEDSRSEYN